MIRNFNIPALNFDGRQLSHADKPLELLDIVKEALCANLPNDINDPANRQKRGVVWQKVCAGGDIELTSDECALIKETANRVCPISILPDLNKILDA